MKYKYILFVFLFSSIGNVSAHNRTDDFIKTEAQPGHAHAKVMKVLKESRVLLVPGFLYENYKFVSDMGVLKNTGVGGYFEDQVHFLERNGIEHHLMHYNSKNSISSNGREIAEELIRWSEVKPRKPIVILAHSKGGLDAFMALVDYPEVRPLVSAFIAMQTPWYGSPIIDALLDNTLTEAISRELMRMLGGDYLSMRDMHTRERKRHMAQIKKSIEDVLSALPVVSLGTYKAQKSFWESPLGWDTMLEPTRNWMLKRGQPNDGLVPLTSAFLEGSHIVLLEGADHAAPAMDNLLNPYDRISLMLSLMALVLN